MYYMIISPFSRLQLAFRQLPVLSFSLRRDPVNFSPRFLLRTEVRPLSLFPALPLLWAFRVPCPRQRPFPEFYPLSAKGFPIFRLSFPNDGDLSRRQPALLLFSEFFPFPRPSFPLLSEESGDLFPFFFSEPSPHKSRSPASARTEKNSFFFSNVFPLSFSTC